MTTSPEPMATTANFARVGSSALSPTITATRPWLICVNARTR